MVLYNYFQKKVDDRIANFKDEEGDMSFLDLYIKELKKGSRDPESFERKRFLVIKNLYL